MGNWNSKRNIWQPLLKLAALWVFSVLSLSAQAVGPAVVAKADQHLWHEPVNTIDGFNLASRASILVYVQALQDMQHLSDNQMLETFKIKGINRASVEKWLAKEYGLSLRNYQLASKSCVADDWTCVGSVSGVADLLKKAAENISKTPQNLLAWRANLDSFSHVYIAEQLRLAALFPRISSEIELFNNNEWNGDQLADRQFFLSFDDGPTDVHGTTEDTLYMLATNHKSAVFFLLGERLQSRLHKTDAAALSGLYKNQCVASHGWEHQSHAKWDQWQNSIIRTQALLNATFDKDNVLPLFRPPYGQRKNDSGAFFASQSLRVALWNLDSQDWNNHVTVSDITNRMMTLMLIKRHGVLLFHDVHPKAKVALPIIFDAFDHAVEWSDCHQLAL
jgi:peptidoglycan/xylan/chitin deacetylase (PgdA/CDA1 family)